MSSSGSGGSPFACPALSLSGPPITYGATEAEHGSRPVLVPVSDDGAAVSVIHARTAVDGTTGNPPRIANVTFSPWGEWPSTLGTEHQVAWLGGEGFAVAPARPAAQPGISTLFFVPTDAFPSDMFFAPSAAPDQSYDPLPKGISWNAWEPAWAVALARGSAFHLAAHQMGFASAVSMSLTLVDEALGITPLTEVACAVAPFPAAVTEAKGGFLVATASGRPFNTCQLDDGIPGPADQLQIMRLDAQGPGLSLSSVFDETDPLAHVALAKAQEGAWVVWQNDGSSGFQPSPVVAARLDEQGFQVGAVFTAVGDGLSSGPIAAAAMGPFLAVAWVDATDPSTPTLRLDLFDDAGQRVAGTSINTGPSWLYDPSLSLLPSPEGTSILLAWSDRDTPAPATARVARFSCDAPL
ncbi:Hypothetical protein A7982_04605 [Minicystis rosea]|nr:Hypothetical protein A7982_04605 [Minicystis rosea]